MGALSQGQESWVVVPKDVPGAHPTLQGLLVWRDVVVLPRGVILSLNLSRCSHLVVGGTGRYLIHRLDLLSCDRRVSWPPLYLLLLRQLGVYACPSLCGFLTRAVFRFHDSNRKRKNGWCKLDHSRNASFSACSCDSTEQQDLRQQRLRLRSCQSQSVTAVVFAHW